MFSMTANLIKKTPLRRGAKLEEIVNWIKNVAPCLVKGHKQSATDTDMIVRHLLMSGFDLQTIAAALMASGYEWTVHDTSINVAMANRRMELDGAFARNSNVPEPPRMGPPGKQPSIEWLKEKARDLDNRFRANAHNPELQEQLVNQTIDILNSIGEVRVEGGNIAPGAWRAAKELERMRDTREEILRNAPNLARIVRQLGPLDLARIQRLPPGPNGSTVRRINPVTPARRAR